MAVLEWLHDLSFITWVRESTSLLGYTLYLALHTVGMVFLVGPNLLIAARVLGLAPGLPLEPMRAFRRVMNIGLWITIVTGSVLFATAPVGYVKNGVFLVKIAAIIAAVACLWALPRELFGQPWSPDALPITARARWLTTATVVLWAVAVVAGRLTAYSGIVVWASLGALAIVIAGLAVLAGVARLVVRRTPASGESLPLDIHPQPAKGGK